MKMKNFVRGGLVCCMVLGWFCLCSCILSKKPLATSNEVHEKKLEGRWTVDYKEPQKETKIYFVRDMGKVYEALDQKDGKASYFFLSKIDSVYFISVHMQDMYAILRLEVSDNKITLYGPDTKASESFKEKFGNKTVAVNISEYELKEWCKAHIENFTALTIRYKKIDGESKKDDEKLLIEAFICKLIACEEKLEFPSKPTNHALERFGENVSNAASKMFDIISEANISSDVRDAALEYARCFSKLARVLRAKPYIPEDEADSFAYGFLQGLNGDLTGGMGAVMSWKKELQTAIEDIDTQKENLRILLIKKGFKF